MRDVIASRSNQDTCFQLHQHGIIMPYCKFEDSRGEMTEQRARVEMAHSKMKVSELLDTA